MVSRTTLLLLAAGAVGVAGIAVARTLGASGGGGGGGTLYDISVVAYDQTGLPVRSANVTIIGVGGGVTDASGLATIPGVPGGSYTLNIDALGFAPLSTTITVSQGSTTFAETLTPTGVCLPKPCPCGQRWDPVACKCAPQTVNSLVVPPTFAFSQSWTVLRQGFWYNPFPSICGYATPGNPSTCPPMVTCLPGSSGCSPCCGHGSDTIQIIVKAVVKDVAGNPVCGVTVDGGITGLVQIPWNSVNFSGVFNLSLVFTSPVSDVDGQVIFIINVQIAQVVSHTTDLLQGGPYPGTAAIPFSLLLNIPGTAIIAPVALTMSAQFCAYYPTCGAWPL